MQTYSHALLTLAAARRFEPRVSLAAAAGATLPDLPTIAGASWLWTRRRARWSRTDFEEQVCGRSLFRRPDAALHSVLPVAATLALYRLSGTRDRTPLAFLLGWAGHVVKDTLTHGSDARPLFWPVSGRRFESPVSYRERGRYGVPFTLAEHAALLFVVWRMLRP